LNACLVNDSLSADYQRHLRDLRKSFRRIDEDLAQGYEDIIKARRSACNALPVPGLASNRDAEGNPVEPRVWKYRIPSRDMQRGKSGGYRILAYYRDNTLYPFCLYTHVQYDGQPPNKKLKEWLGNLVATLPGVSGESTPGDPSMG
jgi:mRNA-degrading endonuclease RelE of RelBE toxin-antitoxin system